METKLLLSVLLLWMISEYFTNLNKVYTTHVFVNSQTNILCKMYLFCRWSEFSKFG